MKNPSVNRSLEDARFDHIDHALGRPFDPLGETYRNHFAVDGGSDLAGQFERSSHWTKVAEAPGRMVFFSVTKEGREALAAHLRELGSPDRLYRVSFAGFSDTIVAPTAGKAKYRRYLSMSDCFCDLSFLDFCKGASVYTVSPRLRGGA